MAIYHLSTKPISRSAGRSAVAAAAYRAAERLVDERTGLEHDYRRKGGVLASEIFLPDGTSVERNALWNAAEAAEKRKDSRTAREWIVAFPAELDAEQRHELATGLAVEMVTRYGVAVDMSLHAPDAEGDNRNHHGHYLLTTRRVSRDESGALVMGGKAVIELSDTARRAQGLGPVADEIKTMRQVWERLANRALQQAGRSERIDARSLRAQGIEREASQHLGPTATEMERRGLQTERGGLNRQAAANDQERAQLKAQVIELEAERQARQARAEQAKQTRRERAAERRAAQQERVHQAMRETIERGARELETWQAKLEARPTPAPASVQARVQQRSRPAPAPAQPAPHQPEPAPERSPQRLLDAIERNTRELQAWQAPPVPAPAAVQARVQQQRQAATPQPPAPVQAPPAPQQAEQTPRPRPAAPPPVRQESPAAPVPPPPPPRNPEWERIERMSAAELGTYIWRRTLPLEPEEEARRSSPVVRAQQKVQELEAEAARQSRRQGQAEQEAREWRAQHPVRAAAHDREWMRSGYLDERDDTIADAKTRQVVLQHEIKEARENYADVLATAVQSERESRAPLQAHLARVGRLLEKRRAQEAEQARREREQHVQRQQWEALGDSLIEAARLHAAGRLHVADPKMREVLATLATDSKPLAQRRAGLVEVLEQEPVARGWLQEQVDRLSPQLERLQQEQRRGHGPRM